MISKTCFPKTASCWTQQWRLEAVVHGDGHLIDHSKTGLDNARAFRNRLKGFDADIFRLSTLTTLKDGIPGTGWKPMRIFFMTVTGIKIS